MSDSRLVRYSHSLSVKFGSPLKGSGGKMVVYIGDLDYPTKLRRK